MLIQSNKNIPQHQDTNKAKDRRKRTHELIEVGAVVSSVIGLPLSAENRQIFGHYLYQHKDEIRRLMLDQT